jgi:hypothetical protein
MRTDEIKEAEMAVLATELWVKEFVEMNSNGIAAYKASSSLS